MLGLKTSWAKLTPIKKRLVVYGGFIALVLGFYGYQPQRLDLFPKPPPNPNPSIDPDTKELFSAGTRVLVVTAHPDDTEFYIGGLLTRLRKSGAVIDEVVCTDGDKSYYLWQDSGKLRKIRRAEQVASAAVSHVHHIQFLAYPDGRLFANPDVIARLHEEFLKSKPEYLIAFDNEYPPKAYHRDHLNSGIAAMLAAQGTSAKWALLFATHAPNFTLDITDEWETQKKLIALHPSQFSGDHLQMVLNMVESNASQDGDRIEKTYGESFRCIRLN